MSSAEFAEWMAFAQVEPFGSPVDDHRFGTVASAAGAAAGIKSRPSDWFKRTADEPTGGWQDVMSAMGAFAAPPRKVTGAASGERTHDWLDGPAPVGGRPPVPGGPGPGRGPIQEVSPADGS